MDISNTDVYETESSFCEQSSYKNEKFRNIVD